MQHAGVGRYGRGLIEGFKKLDDAPEVIVVGRPTDLVARFGLMPFTPWARTAVGRRASRESVDLIHGLHLEVPRSDIPSVVTIPDLIPLEFPESMPSPLRRSIYRNIVTTSVRRAAMVITHSEMTVPSIAALGADPAKIPVIPHGVDPIFRPLSEEEREAARNRFANGRPYVAASVRDKAHKNVDRLAAAAGLLAGKIEVVCSGWIGVPIPNIRFVGELSGQDLLNFYGGAQMLVLPSLVEGFGLPAVEALACGVPVVCGRKVGALSYVRDGVLEVDATDPAQIADGVEKLVVDSNKRLDLSARGINAARQLTIQKEAALTAEVYREVLD